MSGKDLTSTQYWSEYWAERPLRRTKLKRSHAKVLSFILDRVPNPGTVLEAGCAPGEMIVRMARLRHDHVYHGLDFSESGLADAARRLTEIGVPAVLHNGDLRDPGIDERFDLVCSFGLVEHFEDPSEILAAHVRLAKPGGYVGVSLPNYSSAPNRWLIGRLDAPALRAHAFTLMDRDRLRAALEGAGLEDVAVRGFGGPKLRARCPERTPGRKVLRVAARCWNAGTRLVPNGLGWYSTFAGVGRVPSAGPRDPAAV